MSSYRSSSGDPSLQSRLHTLLSHLSDTTKVIKKWPKSENDDASIHTDTTTKLIESIHRIIKSVKDVEDKAFSTPTPNTAAETSSSSSRRAAAQQQQKTPSDTDLHDKLREFQVPLDLLDLMDYGTPSSSSSSKSKSGPKLSSSGDCGLNPDCFARGLLREALKQLAGLKRRKLALEMLGATIQAGMDNAKGGKMVVVGESVKRGRVDDDDDDSDSGEEEVVGEIYKAPTAKRLKK